MHGTTNAMADKLTNHAKAVAFHVVLNCPGNIGHPFTGQSLSDPFVERAFGDIHQSLRLHRATTHRNGPGRIPDKPVIDYADVETNDIPKLDPAITGQSMNNLLVYRDADI